MPRIVLVVGIYSCLIIAADVVNTVGKRSIQKRGASRSLSGPAGAWWKEWYQQYIQGVTLPSVVPKSPAPRPLFQQPIPPPSRPSFQRPTTSPPRVPVLTPPLSIQRPIHPTLRPNMQRPIPPLSRPPIQSPTLPPPRQPFQRPTPSPSKPPVQHPSPPPTLPTQRPVLSPSRPPSQSPVLPTQKQSEERPLPFPPSPSPVKNVKSYSLGPPQFIKRPDRPLPDGEMPPCAVSGENFCIITDDYPEDLVKDIIDNDLEKVRTLYEELQTVGDPELFTNHLYDSAAARGTYACETETGFMRPGWAHNEVSEEWMVIINTDIFPQKIRIETCKKPNQACSYISPFYESTCQQRFSLHRLIAVRPWEPNRSPVVALFKFPAGCACRVARI
ncbi:neurotrophin 1-like [Limulus polyphemus]|uniref:Neurotrophin 1-like n=1 Tax=Limulus polyphemus TaxID=6850 RepID=A0ABM1C564_LIMPO|nr:neurotrophin 1-like [Limulus polyphemus]